MTGSVKPIDFLERRRSRVGIFAAWKKWIAGAGSLDVLKSL